MIKKELNPKHGKRLNECLNEKKMSQKELAEKSGYTKQYISYIVTGKKNMSVESAEIFANILHVRKEYLLCKDDYKTLEDIFEEISNESDILRKAALKMLEIFGIYTVGEPYSEEWSEQEIANFNRLYRDELKIIHRSTDMISIRIGNEEPLEIRYEILLNCIGDIIEYVEFQAEKLKNNYDSLKIDQERRTHQQLRLDENLSSITIAAKKH